MEESALPPTSSCLDLSISFPAASSSGDHGGGRRDIEEIRDLDINKVPEYSVEEDHLAESNSSSSMAMEINHEGGRKKNRLSKHQSKLLEDCFRVNHSLDTKQRKALAVKLELTPRQVEVWFQNRRARRKLKQMETECEYMKRWFISLRAHNRSLKAEVDELRSSTTASAAICPYCHLPSTPTYT
ncbi:hypothetical protein V2J09_003581 [Rumex salicifolius]